MAFISRQAFWRHDIALDVGTATTRVADGLHRMTEQPSRTPSGNVLLQGGVVVDCEAATTFLKPILSRVRAFGIVRPCVLACAPSDVSREERERLVDAIVRAGAASVVVIPEPLAAAIGSGVDVSSPYAQMVIDMGEGVTDCAVIRSSKIRATWAVRGGCAGMRREIISITLLNGEVITEREAEERLRREGIFQSGAGTMCARVVETIDTFLRNLPHDLGCEIIESGIRLTGGGSLIPGMRDLIEERTGISVNPAVNPRSAVVEGARAILPVVAALNQWR